MKCKLSIQEKLKDLRIERGLSLQELSEQTGLSRAALGNYEKEQECLQEALPIIEKMYGEEHPKVVDARKRILGTI